MSTTGELVMNPEQAISKAQEMKKYARDLETLLDNVSNKMTYVNSVDKGMYFGDNKPAMLLEELNKFRKTFVLVRDQVVKSADDIIIMANKAMNQ